VNEQSRNAGARRPRR